MEPTVSLQGVKAQSILRSQSKTAEVEKEAAVRYLPPDLRFISGAKNAIRPPVHDDFNSFMASTSSHIQEKISDSTKLASQIQHYRFSPENHPSQKTSDSHSPSKKEIKITPPQPLNSNTRDPITEMPKLLEMLSSTQIVRPAKLQFNSDKGYGSRTVNDPLIALATSANLDKTSIGLIGGINKQSQFHDQENDPSDFGAPKQKSKMIAGNKEASRNEHANLLRREEIEVLRDVKEKFLQQLNAQHPHISVPIKHPEGIVDVHMRFDRKSNTNNRINGSVRVMFSGSNPEIVSLFAQHREEFMKIITNEGYTIEPSRMQFNTIRLTKQI